MLDKFLREAVVVAVGKQFENVADLLNSKKHVNEFIIAKKMDITINQTRNILYKLSNHGLVSSIRKKDKRKGWYTYFWKLEIIKCLEFLKGILEKRIDQVRHHIKNRETKQFYACKKCNIEFNEENALLHNFTCNECGEIFSAKDNSKVLRDAKRELDKFNRELVLINEVVEKENEKIEKIKLREMKKLEKEKKKIKSEAAKKRSAKKKTVHSSVSTKTLSAKGKKKDKIKKPLKKVKKKNIMKKVNVKDSLKKKIKKKDEIKKPLKKKIKFKKRI